MADLVDLVLEDKRWLEMHLGQLAQTACAACLRHLKLDPAEFEISLLGCDDARISALNTDFRGKAAATNVLSWPSQNLIRPQPGAAPAPPVVSAGAPHSLGDIAISYETCQKEATLAARPQDQHVCHLLVHATLHLLGYDHIVTQDAALMENLERQVLATLGHPDPYVN